jgi:hypothetical protein
MMTYYAITGRVHGDDEDVCVLVEAASRNEAVQQFLDIMREQAGITFDPADEYTNVYVNSIVSSATPISYEA